MPMSSRPTSGSTSRDTLSGTPNATASVMPYTTPRNTTTSSDTIEYVRANWA